ncbi:MAG: MarR family winged helix-turn-helix transcriptional regulator [Acidobacteriaceae bacterium]
MSTANRAALHASLIRNIRYFIAGTILFNQKVADAVGMHLTDMQCLNLLELEGSMTPGTLGKWMGLSSGGVTVMLDRLGNAGFIQRASNPADRRSILVRANPRKAHKIQSHYAQINREVEAFLAESPAAELEAANRFLERINTTRVGPANRKPQG